jgi:hypothetical protein
MIILIRVICGVLVSCRHNAPFEPSPVSIGGTQTNDLFPLAVAALIASCLRLSELSQSLLRLAKPIVHAHLLEHGLGLLQVLQGLFSPTRIGIKSPNY